MAASRLGHQAVSANTAHRQSISPDRNRPELLVDRILRILPGPWWLWAAVWAAMAVGNALVLDAVAADAERSALPVAEPVGVAITVYAMAVAFSGSRYLHREAYRVGSDVAALQTVGTGAFASLGSTLGPIGVAAALTVAEATFVAAAAPAALVATPLLFAIHVPLAQGIWVTSAVFWSIYRLGRGRVHLDVSSTDPSLGLAPLGRLAYATFAILLAAAVPVLVANTDSALALVVNLSVIAVAVLALLGSLWRLHRVMAETRRRLVSAARHRLTEALESAGSTAASAVTATTAAAVHAADIALRRAEAIRTWPLTSSVVKQLAGMTTFVITGLVTRAIATAIGW